MLDVSSSFTTISGVTNLKALRCGKVVSLSFQFKPTATGFTGSVVTVPQGMRPPGATALAVTTAVSTGDAAVDCVAVMTQSGAVTIIASGALPSNPLVFSCTYIVAS